MTPSGKEHDARSGVLGPNRRTYDLHPPGLIFVVTAVFLAVGAFNSQNNLLFWAFGVSVAAVVISGVVSGAPLMAIRLSRLAVSSPQAGRTARIQYRIANRSRWWPVFALRIEEVLEAADGGGRVRAIGSVGHIGPGESLLAEASAASLNRGRYGLSSVRLTTTFPFGLIRKSLHFDVSGSVLVRPTVAPLRRGLQQVVQSRAHQSLRSRNRVGMGDEFFGLREYVPGDPMRTVAWKQSARTAGLVVRQMATPSPPRVWLELQKPDARVDRQTFESAVALLASAAVHAERKGQAPGVTIPWADVVVPPVTSAAALDRLLETLAGLRLERDAGGAEGRIESDVEVGYAASKSEKVLDGSSPDAWTDEAVAVYVPVIGGRRRKRIRRAMVWMMRVAGVGR